MDAHKIMLGIYEAKKKFRYDNHGIYPKKIKMKSEIFFELRTIPWNSDDASDLNFVGYTPRADDPTMVLGMEVEEDNTLECDFEICN